MRLRKECAVIEKELVRRARGNELATRSMTVPGVDPIVALSFIATVDDAARFAKSTQVGAYLGLTPRHHQSGEIDYSGRISKCGDSGMRALPLKPDRVRQGNTVGILPDIFTGTTAYISELDTGTRTDR